MTATGRLADPSDLAFDDAHLTDPDALTAAIDDLLARKPHLASRRVVGDVGQGAGKGDTPVDLAGMLRRNASLNEIEAHFIETRANWWSALGDDDRAMMVGVRRR